MGEGVEEPLMRGLAVKRDGSWREWRIEEKGLTKQGLPWRTVKADLGIYAGASDAELRVAGRLSKIDEFAGHPARAYGDPEKVRLAEEKGFVDVDGPLVIYTGPKAWVEKLP